MLFYLPGLCPICNSQTFKTETSINNPDTIRENNLTQVTGKTEDLCQWRDKYTPRLLVIAVFNAGSRTSTMTKHLFRLLILFTFFMVKLEPNLDIMKEAIFGLIGVLVGSTIPWLQAYLTSRNSFKKNARYLAIRLICILDKYLQDCVDVVKDDGLSFGQYNKDGVRQSQVAAPGPPIYPEDVDWKSIDHELMYKILSFPSEVDTGDRIIQASGELAGPPDYEEWFTERKYRYSQFGLIAFHLSEELAKKYNIKMKTYEGWDPVEDMKIELHLIDEKRNKKLRQQKSFVNKVLGENQLDHFTNDGAII